jgi:transposase
MAKRSMFVGMDVHKESIDISLAEEARDGEVRHYGAIVGDLEAVAKLVRALRAPNRLRFVYEAGPRGFAHRSAMARPSSRWRASLLADGVDIRSFS